MSNWKNVTMSHGRVCGVTMSQCHIGGCVVSDVKEWHPALMSDVGVWPVALHVMSTVIKWKVILWIRPDRMMLAYKVKHCKSAKTGLMSKRQTIFYPMPISQSKFEQHQRWHCLLSRCWPSHKKFTAANFQTKLLRMCNFHPDFFSRLQNNVIGDINR